MRRLSRYLANYAPKHLRQIILLTSIASFGALAGPISLAPIEGDTAPSVVGTFNVYGTCGSATVQIVGVQRDTYHPEDNHFQFDSSALASGVFVIGDGGKTMKMPVSDYNTVLCVPVQREFRLVVGSQCSGSVCSDAFNYSIYNPKRNAIVSPKSCNISCASKLLESNVLSEIGLL